MVDLHRASGLVTRPARPLTAQRTFLDEQTDNAVRVAAVSPPSALSLSLRGRVSQDKVATGISKSMIKFVPWTLDAPASVLVADEGEQRLKLGGGREDDDALAPLGRARGLVVRHGSLCVVGWGRLQTLVVVDKGPAWFYAVKREELEGSVPDALTGRV